VDSHTEGEPTRVVVSGFPELPGETMAERRGVFDRDFMPWLGAIVREPRGNDVLVGAILDEPISADSVASVLFFNTAGSLGMCGHGLIGVAKTLQHLGMVREGRHQIDTPAGTVSFDLLPSGYVEIVNVASYHYRSATVEVAAKTFHGDVAYGGNWFFITHDVPCPIGLATINELTDISWAIRRALVSQGVTGADDAEIDHIELCTLPPGVSRNFVLCPGGAYDRSPCGTGTSAHMACLVRDGLLKEGEEWIQESVIGSRFYGRVRTVDGAIIPTIRGRAFITGEGELLIDEADPFCWGITQG
jgi:proline racemase